MNSRLLPVRSVRKQLFTACSVALLFVVSVPLPARAAAGDLDSTFGDGGEVVTLMPDRGWADQIAIQPDGKLVVSGFDGKDNVTDFGIVRYNTDGSLDTTFGPDGTGIVITDFGGQDYARAVILQPDGKILAGGSGANDFAMARYSTDGTLDPTFGVGGKVTTDFAGSQDVIRGLVLQPDGKIVAAGFSGTNANFNFALARYNSDGSLDTTFGTNGLLTTDFGAVDEGRGVVLQADGKIVVAGLTRQSVTVGDFALARYLANGTLDTTFGTGGKLTTDFGAYEVARAIVLQPDGKIVAGGYSGCCGGGLPRTGQGDADLAADGLAPVSESDYAVARFNSDGSLDTTFGPDHTGKVTTDLGNTADHARGVALQADGKIVLAGNSETLTDPTVDHFSLARYNTDGTLDTTFGTSGVVLTEIGSGQQQGARDVKVQADGKIVTAGIIQATGGGFNFALARYLGQGSIPPTISGVFPASGVVSGGQCAIISGTGFQTGATVTFGSSTASPEYPPAPTTITVDTPTGSGTVDVTVTNPDGTSATDPGAYTYSGSLTSPSPKVGLSPGATGSGGPQFDVFDTTAAGTVEHLKWACPPGWSGTENLSGAVVHGPAVSNMYAPQLQVFAQGSPTNALMEDARDASGVWSGWTSLSGVLSAKPAAVSWGPGRIDVFVRGTDTHVWQKSFAGGVWSGWSSLGGALLAGSGPAVASMAPNQLEVFAVGTNKGIWEKTWNGSVWSGWSSLGGVIVGDPGAASPVNNQVQVFARGTDNHLYYRSFASGVWGGWKSLGGTLTSGPAAAVAPAGANPSITSVYALWTDNALWQIRNNGLTWGTWTKVP
jgi:uncharacterized delta-60 repeat protein